MANQTINNWDKLRQAFYDAALKAIKETGEAYKNLSWFGRNKNG